MNRAKLGEITKQIFDGKHGGCTSEPESGYYFISVKDIDGEELHYDNAMQIPKEEFDKIYWRTHLENGDTLFANTGDTIGKSVFVKDNPLVNRTAFQKSVAVVKPNPSYVDPAFLYYLMRYETPRLRAAASGSGQKNLLLDTMRNFMVNIPDRETQSLIGGVLVSIDNKVHNNIAICTDSEHMLKLLYDYWFIQFDFPDRNGKPYKSSGGKMVWNEILKKEIPEGWGVGSIVNNPLTSVIGTGVEVFEKKNYLPTANIVGETITDGDWISFDNRESRANMQPARYSIWFAKMKKSIKHLSIPASSDWFIQKYILSTGFEGIQCDELSFGFIHCLVNSDYFEKHKDIVAHGATQESVNDDDLNCIKFVIPPKEVLQAFSQIVNPILEMKFHNIEENQQLSALRNFLLPMLMNGQVKVGKNR